ncbi:MAG: hypothetical protein C4522_03640 [Desulfobacteraceae bacterium]|nr:MAG: hypothetical protein C4522_03640 [Desulfobacteraceae bacterium]
METESFSKPLALFQEASGIVFFVKLRYKKTLPVSMSPDIILRNRLTKKMNKDDNSNARKEEE